MHKDFADWYRVVSIEPQQDDLKKRWQGVIEFADDTSDDDLLELVRMFFGMPTRAPTTIEKFRAVFKKVDESFPMRGNDAEIKVLSGATLAALLEYGEQWGNASALALACMSFRERRLPAVPEIITLTRAYLVTTSIKLRASSEDVPEKLKLTEQFELLKKGFPANNVVVLGEPTLAILQSLIKTTNDLREWALQSDLQHRLRREESDALWWIFGATSRDLNKRFSSLALEAIPLVAGKELGDLIQALPGPVAAPALLANVLRQNQMGDESTKVQLKDAVDATSLEWRKLATAVEELSDVSDLCPVHAALMRSVEAGGRKAWQAVFANASGIRATEKFTRLDWAMQAYEERLLMRALRELE